MYTKDSKIRNWDVDDELNRNWMKLLLWLREAFEQETEGMTTKVTGSVMTPA